MLLFKFFSQPSVQISIHFSFYVHVNTKTYKSLEWLGYFFPVHDSTLCKTPVCVSSTWYRASTSQLNPPLVLWFIATGKNKLSFLFVFFRPLQIAPTAPVGVGDGVPLLRSQEDRQRRIMRESAGGGEWERSVWEHCWCHRALGKGQLDLRRSLGTVWLVTWFGRDGCHGALFKFFFVFQILGPCLRSSLKGVFSSGTGDLSAYRPTISLMKQLLSVTTLVKTWMKFSGANMFERNSTWSVLLLSDTSL